MSIRIKVSLFLVVLGAVLLGTIGYVSYDISMTNAKAEAKAKAKVVLGYMASMRGHLVKVQRPLLKTILEKDRFYPELQSGAALVRGVSQKFVKKFADYNVKLASLDPFVPSNEATPHEATVLKSFAANPAKGSLDGFVERDGKLSYYAAKAMPIRQKCLRCHGKAAKAPKDVRELYGTERGYDKKVGDIHGATMVYVPLQKQLDSAKATAIKLASIGGGVMVVIFLGIWFFLGSLVFGPLAATASRVEQISLGQGLDQPIDVKSHDEMGAMHRSVERLRISMQKILLMLRDDDDDDDD